MRSFLSLLAAVFLLINAQWIVAVEPTAEATTDPAFTPITRNSDWTPVERDFDGVTMVLVPSGCFLMGSDDGGSDERPVHEQCFDQSFWIDKYEVTQAQFGRLDGTQAHQSSFSGDEHPVENITWFEARDFCALRGGYLPTEAEWEYAARGPDNLVYPWGNTWNEDNAVWKRDNSEGTADVGSIPAGISWVGALDMSGNVWEWTSSLYEPYPVVAGDGRERDTGASTDVGRVLRGGQWFSNGGLLGLSAWYRFRVTPGLRGSAVGFRCARSYDDATADTTEETPGSTTVPGEGSPVAGNSDWTPVTRNSDWTPVTRNSDWTPVEREFDGVTMVLVPAGCFQMGSNNGDSNERPVHEQCFEEPFWMDKTEVTQAQFGRLGGRQANAPGFSGDNRPVERITWFEARDFCALRGGRLPTEAEWEYAARGPENWVYPWGNDWNADNAVWRGNSNGETAQVGSRPAGASWVGALDMSGNVWEWTSSLYWYYPYDAQDGRERDTGASTDVRRVSRGGSWLNSFIDRLRAPYRFRGVYSIGFRCARSYDGASADTTEETSESPVLPGQGSPVTRNSDWTPVEREFDGVTMVLVPAGCFDMGSHDGDSDERPVHEQCFDEPFWMDKTEVTQAQFGRLGGRQANTSYFSGDNRPVENITWFEARDFCERRGGRLPSEAEWEYAARGPESRVYPWGDEWNGNNAVWNRNSTVNVGSIAAGASWVGALDLSGNVWEWTNSLYEPYPYASGDGRERDTGASTDVRRVMRGGAWGLINTDLLRAPYRSWVIPDLRFGDGGFRCARSFE